MRGMRAVASFVLWRIPLVPSTPSRHALVCATPLRHSLAPGPGYRAGPWNGRDQGGPKREFRHERMERAGRFTPGDEGCLTLDRWGVWWFLTI